MWIDSESIRVRNNRENVSEVENWRWLQAVGFVGNLVSTPKSTMQEQVRIDRSMTDELA